MSLVHRATVALLSTGLAVSAAVAAAPAQAAAAPSSQADHGATWLSAQLTDGLVVGQYFDSMSSSWVQYNDYGLTADHLFALKAIGGHGSEVHAASTSLAANVDSYVTGDSMGDPGSTYAGATAKSLVAAQLSGADPTDFGGLNLVSTLNRTVTKSGPAKGRIADVSAFGDYANTLGQVLAVRGLTTAKSYQGKPATSFLLKQQCKQGYFRLTFAKSTAANQSCTSKSLPDPDATSYAVIELWGMSKNDARLRVSLKKAVAWLIEQQRSSGAFVGGASTATTNANSTGLAAWALGLAGQCQAAKSAATWVAGLQVGSEKSGPLAGQKGAIAYDSKALKAGQKDGITNATQDQWRRATSQAAPGLLFRHGC
jgi:hypothetical protein